jgi:hypothetical protein
MHAVPGTVSPTDQKRAAFEAFKTFVATWLEWQPNVPPMDCHCGRATTGSSPTGLVGIFMPGSGGGSDSSSFLDLSKKEVKQSRLKQFLAEGSWLTFRIAGNWKTPVPVPFPSLLMWR